MGWTVPEHSKAKVDAAGRIITAPVRDIGEYLEAMLIVNNWRSAHSFPLNTFQTGLRKRGRRIDQDCLVAQRIKRLSSITSKLRRFPGLRLSQMQDLGGCRAVLTSVDEAGALVDSYIQSDVKHQLAAHDDYILTPQASGYRGVHLIYKYNSDRSQTYNSLKIEMQIRTQFQHAWATAVETVGTFIRQALKSNQGEEEWLRFFALMGTAISVLENTPRVPGTPESDDDLLAELKGFAAKLNVENRLHAYGMALQTLENTTGGDARYFLLALDPASQSTQVTGYKSSELQKAQKDYLDFERYMETTGGDAVLVSVESVVALRKAYPNYFLDTSMFLELVKESLGGAI